VSLEEAACRVGILACSLPRSGLQRCLAVDRAGFNLVLIFAGWCEGHETGLNEPGNSVSDQSVFSGSDCNDECRCNSAARTLLRTQIRIFRFSRKSWTDFLLLQGKRNGWPVIATVLDRIDMFIYADRVEEE
jgi:hypothetical protein